MPNHLHKKPQIPPELTLYHFLQVRKTLSPEEENIYKNIQKGYIGEQNFFKFLNKNLQDDKLLLNSLTLSYNNSTFQIDSLLIWHDTVYLFEVKNFEGDFYIKEKNWYIAPSGKEINNPLIQLARSESLLRQLIHQIGFHFKMKSYVVFINPEFALFQASLNLPIILHAQLHRFFEQINQIPFTQTLSHNQLANLLIKRHIASPSYEQLPKYSFEQLKKGIVCKSCSEFMSIFNQKKLICNTCGNKETIEHAVIRSVKEFKILFPDRKITTKTIYEWMSVPISRKTVWRILRENLKAVYKGNDTYYEL